MQKFGISQSVTRREDDRFVTGRGQYLEDVAPTEALHAVFFRSAVAHAELKHLDLQEARAVPGVAGIFTATDLDGVVSNRLMAMAQTNRDGTKGADVPRPVLADGRVRYVGEPIAIIVAHTKAAALEALDLIDVDYDDLDVALALEPGAPLHADAAPENLAFDWGIGDADGTEAAFAAAEHRVALRVEDTRVFTMALEPRACSALWRDGRLEFTFGGQNVWGIKAQLAGAFGLRPENVMTKIPDVGGGFGMKAFMYPEYVAVAFAARHLGHPVRWAAERSESMLSDNSGRDLTSLAEAAFDADKKLTALRVTTDCNLGAYNSFFGQFIQSQLASRVFPGVYDVQTGFMQVRGWYSNTTPVDAYRGAGRPEAIYILERLMDRAARDLGLSQSDIRRRSFIPAASMPYDTLVGETYDVGDFDKVLKRAEAEADMAGFATRRAGSAAKGKLRGVGLCYYIESILGQPTETTHIEFTQDGGVNLYVGTQSNGQGHETVYTQVLHDRLGWDFDKIRIIQGDSDAIPAGGGTGGSRSVTMQGNSIISTSDVVIEKYKAQAAEELEASAADITFEAGQFSIVGTDRQVSLGGLVAKALAQGDQDLISTRTDYKLPARSFPNGAHVAEVEIDPDTGQVDVVKYTVVDDFGLLMNPMLAEGQVHGGVVQGLGQVLLERVVYDETGQLLTGSLMDYGVPRADDVPNMRFATEPTLSTANELGMKGCGEAGTVGSMAAVMNALQDALWDQGVQQIDMPATPERIWRALNP